MKKGIVSGVVRPAVSGEPSAEKVFDLAAEAGFHGVELQAGEPPREFDENTSPARIGEIRKAAEKTGVEIFSVMPVARMLGAVDEETRSEAVRGLEETARRACDLGAETLLVVPGRVTSDCPYREAFENAKRSLQDLAERISDIPLTLAVENVWNKFLYSPLEFARFVDEAGMPNVKAYFDVGNVMMMGFPEQWINVLGDRIDKVHVKDYLRDRPGNTGFCNLLEGDVPWPEVMAALKRAGYDGFVTAEVAGYKAAPALGLKAVSEALDYILSL